jgi:HK97 family phage portal protein
MRLTSLGSRISGFFRAATSGLRISRRSADEPGAPQLSPSALAWLAGADVAPAGAVLNNAYQQVPWVYRAINLLAEQVANVPFLFSAGDRGRENLITTGPLGEFYARPHPHINRFQYWELRVIWLMLRGECMRVPIFNDGATLSFKTPNSKIKSVLILDPARFQHIIENNQLVAWRYTGFGHEAPLDSQVFLPEEVWFEKLANPFDFWRGMPPLMVASLATRTDFASAAFMHGLMDNNADLGVIVRTEQALDDRQQEQILAHLRQRKRRAGTADKPLLLWSGAEVVKPQLSSADLQFLENRKFTRSEICAAFGVPEEVVTATDHSKYDVMAGARLNFIENRVAPFCRRLEAEEEATVKAIDPRATGWFDIEALPIMQEALRKRLLSAKVGFDMGVPLNHLNRLFDLGFPSLPWGDTGYLPSKYQPAAPSPPKSQSPS